MKNPRPLYTAAQAVERMLALARAKTGQYVLGTGDSTGYTTRDGLTGADCVIVAVYGYGIPRHRPGYNHGSWATIADDINCNSLIEDADHEGDLTERIYRPEVGCFLTYPSVYKDGHRISIGHIELVTGVSRCLEWDVTAPDYGLLDVVACRGPNERKPAVITGTGADGPGRGFNGHDKLWPKPAHRTSMLRVKP